MMPWGRANRNIQYGSHMALFEEDEDDDKDVKLDAWMWLTIAFGTIVTAVATFFVVRAVANLF